MDIAIQNLISAVGVGVIIGSMALTTNPQLKATLYSLPIPITLALIISSSNINSSHIIGLLLLCGFLWLVFYFNKLKINIFIADIISVLLYVSVGYILINFTAFGFYQLTFAYLLLWLLFIYALKTKNIKGSRITVKKKTTINPYVKGFGVSVISFLIFSFKNVLSGIIVTFPYSGVFAVLESQSHLKTLALIFTRNSIAILGLFVVMFVLQSHVNLAIQLLFGWVVYFIILKLVSFIKI